MEIVPVRLMKEWQYNKTSVHRRRGYVAYYDQADNANQTLCEIFYNIHISSGLCHNEPFPLQKNKL